MSQIQTIDPTASLPSEEVTKTVEARRVLGRFISDLEQQGMVDTLSRLPDVVERAVLVDRHHALAGSLRGCSYSMAGRDRASKAVASMFREGWPTYKFPNDRVEPVITAYVTNLQEYPAWAIESICAALKSGTVEDQRLDFPPTSARMAQLCAAKIADMTEEKARFARVLAIKVERAPYVPDEVRAASIVEHEAWKQKHLLDVESEEEAACKKKLADATIARNKKEIIDEYRARNIPPILGPGGIPISLSLVRNIQEYAARRTPPPDQGHEK